MQAESIRRENPDAFHNGNFMGHISDYSYNKDRIITAKGQSDMKVFVCGSKSIAVLPTEAESLIHKLCSEGVTFLIGDCYGVDRAAQQALYERNYPNVAIYTACNKVRNNVGGWPVFKVNPGERPGYIGHRRKDMAMIHACDMAIAVWDGKSKGTGANLAELRKLGKEVAIFM